MTRTQSFFLVTLLSFTTYLFTLAPVNTGFGDSDELITSGYFLSISHPPGYPLLTLLTHLITHIIPFGSIAYKAHLLSAIFHSFTIGLVYLLIQKVFNSKNHLAILLPLFLAFSPLFWLYSNLLEVMPLNNFLIVLTLYLAISYPHKIYPYITYGLALSHHQLSLLFIPSFIILTFTKKSLKSYFLNLISVFVIFAIIYSTQLLFNHSAPVSWDIKPSINGLISHLTRQDFGGFLVNTGDVQPSYLSTINPAKSLQSLSVYFSALISRFTFVSPILFILGLLLLIKTKKFKILISIFTLYLFSGPFLAAYLTIPNTAEAEKVEIIATMAMNERMLLFSDIFYALFIIFGLIYLSNIFKKHSLFFSVLLFSILLYYCISNYPKANLNSYHYASDISLAQLNQTQKYSVLICFSDVSCFTLLYKQQVEGFRKDVTIVPITPQLRDTHLKSINPSLFSASYPDNPYRIGQVIASSWQQSASVYVTELPVFYTKFIGLDKQFYLKDLGNGLAQIGCGLDVHQPSINTTKINPPTSPIKYINLHSLIYQSTPAITTSVCKNTHALILDSVKCMDLLNPECSVENAYWATLQSPQDYLAHMQLAHAHEAMKALPLAKREYQIALNLSPKNQFLIDKLKELEGVDSLR